MKENNLGKKNLKNLKFLNFSRDLVLNFKVCYFIKKINKTKLKLKVNEFENILLLTKLLFNIIYHF